MFVYLTSLRQSILINRSISAQEMYKPTSMQSVKVENTSSGNHQISQFNILPAPAVSTLAPNLTATSPQVCIQPTLFNVIFNMSLFIRR